MRGLVIHIGEPAEALMKGDRDREEGQCNPGVGILLQHDLAPSILRR